MKKDIPIDAALAQRWNEAAAVSRSIAAAAAAIAAMPPMLSAPPDLPIPLTNAKMRMLSWPCSVAEEPISLVQGLIEAGNLAPMLDCDALERQLAESLAPEAVSEGLASVPGLVTNVISGQRRAAKAAGETIERWRSEIDDSHAQLRTIGGQAAVEDAVLRNEVEALGAAIGTFSDASAARPPRAVLVWLSDLEALAFGVVADDETATALSGDVDVLHACRAAASAFAAASEAERYRLLFDAALRMLGGASADAARLAELAFDTAAAWQSVEARLARTTSGDASGNNQAIRARIDRTRADVQCVHDVQEVFRAAAMTMMPVEPAPIQFGPSLRSDRVDSCNQPSPATVQFPLLPHFSSNTTDT